MVSEAGVIRWDILIQLFAIVSAGVGVYAAVRSDLARMNERQDSIDDRHDDLKEVVGKQGDKIDRHIEANIVHTVRGQ